MKLQRIDRDGLELVVNLEDGSVYASQSAVARMVERGKTTIFDWVKSCSEIQVLDAEIQTEGGLQGVRLLDENGIYQAFAKYKPELLIQCAKAGLRLFLHELAGFHYSVSQPVVQPSITRVLTEFEVVQLVSQTNKTYLEIQNGMAQYDVRLAQICIDRMIQAVNANQKLLPASNEPQLSGCVEIGTKLGYNVGKEDRGLGRYVAKAWRNAYSSEPLKAKREVGGAMRDVGVYPSEDPVVISAIKDYYAKRNAKL